MTLYTIVSFQYLIYSLSGIHFSILKFFVNYSELDNQE